MTVEDTNNRKDYDPDGVEDTFIYNFRVDTASDMVVYADGDLYEEPFTMTGLGDEEGGDVIFDIPPIASITTLTLIREMPLTQETDYPPLGPFPAPSHEQALDKLTWICQQLQEELSRALIAPVNQEGDYTLPPYAAGEYWKWDETVQEIITSTLEDIGTASIGTAVGDLMKLIDVGGGIAGFPLETKATLTTAGDIIYASAANVLARLAKGVDGQVLSLEEGIPVWANEGKLIQQVVTEDGEVATGATLLPIDDTTPQITEGDEYLTRTITPTNAANKIKIDVVLLISNTNTNTRLGAALFQDAISDALAGMVSGRDASAASYCLITFSHVMVAGTTNEITYRVRAGTGTAGTNTVNGSAGVRLFNGKLVSSITVTEIKP